MSRSESFLPTGDPLSPAGAFATWLFGVAAVLLLGLALAALLARLMRAKDLHWSWAGLTAAAIVVLRIPLQGGTAVLFVTALGATLKGRRWHCEDVVAGADLARVAARRKSPVTALGTTWHALALRRREGSQARWIRGEEIALGLDERGRVVSIPLGGTRGGTHTLLVGATGSGKTVTQTWLTIRAIEAGMGSIVLDPKGDEAMRVALEAAAHRADRSFLEWTPEGPSTYNPFASGSASEIADKALAGERFTEPHYLRQAQRFLGHVVRALRSAGVEIGLPQIVQHLDPAELELLARELSPVAADAAHSYLDSLTTRQVADLAGVRDRLSILTESDVGQWLDPAGGAARRFDLLGAAEERAVVYFRLDADRRPLLAQMLGAAIVQDLQTVVSSLQTSPVPTVIVIDEFSALAAEHVVRLFGRARSAGFSLILSTQELSDLRLAGREALLEQVLGNLTVLLAHRQVVASSAELIAGLAGKRGVWRTSHSSDGRTTRTRTQEGVLQPADVIGLGPGSAAAIVLSDGGSARITRVFSPDREGR
jgi:type IV secretory pathway TraG/TraD family ATPase VirD4